MRNLDRIINESINEQVNRIMLREDIDRQNAHSMNELRITNSLKLTKALANVGLGRKGMEALIVEIIME